MSLLFAIDNETQEVIVSESTKENNRIDFIERIKKNENLILFNAVLTLTSISTMQNIDVAIFKAMDKVCQMIYNKHKENN